MPRKYKYEKPVRKLIAEGKLKPTSLLMPNSLHNRIMNMGKEMGKGMGDIIIETLKEKFPEPKISRELSDGEKKDIDRYIDDIKNFQDTKFREDSMERLFWYIDEIEANSKWYAHENMFNLIMGCLGVVKYTGKPVTNNIRDRLFSLLLKAFRHGKFDKQWYSQWKDNWFEKTLKRLKEISENSKMDVNHRDRVIRILAEMQDENGNLLPPVLTHFLDLVKSLSEEDYRKLHLSAYVGSTRTLEERRKIYEIFRKWVTSGEITDEVKKRVYELLDVLRAA